MMTSSPIVQRELRAASRRPSTRRIRCWTALLAIGASLIALAAGFAIPGAGSSANPLFGVQTTCAFGLALMAGVFLTSRPSPIWRQSEHSVDGQQVAVLDRAVCVEKPPPERAGYLINLSFLLGELPGQ